MKVLIAISFSQDLKDLKDLPLSLPLRYRLRPNWVAHTLPSEKLPLRILSHLVMLLVLQLGRTRAS